MERSTPIVPGKQVQGYGDSEWVVSHRLMMSQCVMRRGDCGVRYEEMNPLFISCELSELTRQLNAR